MPKRALLGEVAQALVGSPGVARFSIPSGAVKSVSAHGRRPLRRRYAIRASLIAFCRVWVALTALASWVALSADRPMVRKMPISSVTTAISTRLKPAAARRFLGFSITCEV